MNFQRQIVCKVRKHHIVNVEQMARISPFVPLMRHGVKVVHLFGNHEKATCPGVGVTKPISCVPLFSTFPIIVKTNVSY